MELLAYGLGFATILNDHFEDYEYDENAPRHRDEGYSIVKFYPKKD